MCIYVRWISDGERIGYVGGLFLRVRSCKKMRTYAQVGERKRECCDNSGLCVAIRTRRVAGPLQRVQTPRSLFRSVPIYSYITNILQRTFICYEYFYEYALPTRTLCPSLGGRSHVCRICRKLVKKNNRVLDLHFFLHFRFLFAENFVKNSKVKHQ